MLQSKIRRHNSQLLTQLRACYSAHWAERESCAVDGGSDRSYFTLLFFRNNGKKDRERWTDEEHIFFFLGHCSLCVLHPFFVLFTPVCHLELSIYHDTTFLVVALLFAVSPFFSLFIAFSFGHRLFYRHCIPSFPSLSLLRHDSSSLPFAFFYSPFFQCTHTHRERDFILTFSLNSDYKVTSL